MSSLLDSVRAYWYGSATPASQKMDFSTALILSSPSTGPRSALTVLLEWVVRLLYRRSLLGAALDREVNRGVYVDEQGEVQAIAAGTLLLADWAARKRAAHSLATGPLSDEDVKDLASLIAESEGLEANDARFLILRDSLKRVAVSQRIVAAATRRSTQTPPIDGESIQEGGAEYEKDLRELYGLLKPGKSLGNDLVTKSWQDLGFQGTRPATDLRSIGLLGIDSLLYFARTYDDRAAAINREANTPQPGEPMAWYPFALASLAITAHVLAMAQQGSLRLYIFRGLQVLPNSEEGKEYEVLLRAHAELLLVFHEWWMYNGYTVMQFESVFNKDFKRLTEAGLQRTGAVQPELLGLPSTRGDLSL